jgi:hypothetical protein
MKIYGGVDVQLNIPDLGNRRWMVRVIIRPLYPGEKSLRYLRDDLDAANRKFIAPARNRILAVHPVAHRYTEVPFCSQKQPMFARRKRKIFHSHEFIIL